MEEQWELKCHHSCKWSHSSFYSLHDLADPPIPGRWCYVHLCLCVYTHRSVWLQALEYGIDICWFVLLHVCLLVIKTVITTSLFPLHISPLPQTPLTPGQLPYPTSDEDESRVAASNVLIFLFTLNMILLHSVFCSLSLSVCLSFSLSLPVCFWPYWLVIAITTANGGQFLWRQ